MRWPLTWGSPRDAQSRPDRGRAGGHGPTTCSFPQAYLLLESGPDGTTIRLVPIVGHDGMLRGYQERRTDTLTARELTAMASVRLANFPLIDR